MKGLGGVRRDFGGGKVGPRREFAFGGIGAGVFGVLRQFWGSGKGVQSESCAARAWVGRKMAVRREEARFIHASSCTQQSLPWEPAPWWADQAPVKQ